MLSKGLSLIVSPLMTSQSFCWPTVLFRCVFLTAFHVAHLIYTIHCRTAEDGRVQTLGIGLERDVLSAAFNRYISSSATWLSPRYDGRASIQTSCVIWRALSGLIPDVRIQSMKVLGVICALMLIHGICPEPLNPLIFQFIIYDCDFGSLHQALIQEWHPTLFTLINTWLETGPEGSLEPFRGHFASYHDLDVSRTFLSCT